MTGLDDKERCLELVESIRFHVMSGCLCFLFLQLRLVTRQRSFSVMANALLHLVSIFQVFIPNRRVLVGDVIGNHTLSGSHTYPHCWECVRICMKGLLLFVGVIDQLEITPIR